jgi:hypothetical protein
VQKKVMKETESPDSTPEQLMQMLDIQLAMQRSHRAKSGRNRAIFLAGGILFIVIAAGAALLVLDDMIRNLGENRPPRTPAPATPAPAAGKF